MVLSLEFLLGLEVCNLFAATIHAWAPGQGISVDVSGSWSVLYLEVVLL